MEGEGRRQPGRELALGLAMTAFMADACGGGVEGAIDAYFIGEPVEGTKAVVADASGGGKAA